MLLRKYNHSRKLNLTRLMAFIVNMSHNIIIDSTVFYLKHNVSKKNCSKWSIHSLS